MVKSAVRLCFQGGEKASEEIEFAECSGVDVVDVEGPVEAGIKVKTEETGFFDVGDRFVVEEDFRKIDEEFWIASEDCKVGFGWLKDEVPKETPVGNKVKG
jgi:hypothetical protein